MSSYFLVLAVSIALEGLANVACMYYREKYYSIAPLSPILEKAAFFK